MEGFDLLGADSVKLKKAAPYIGAGIGAVVGGVLTRLIFGKYAKTVLRPFGMRIPFPAVARYGVGAAVGAGLGAGVGVVVKKKTTSDLPAKPSVKKLPGAK